MWFNAGRAHVPIQLAENDWVESGEVVLSTDPQLTVGTPVKAGDRITAAPPVGRGPPPSLTRR